MLMLDKCGEGCYSKYHQVAYGNSPYGLRPWKGIDMSKFSISLRDAFEEAFQKEESREDFLREVFAALEGNRKVTLKGRPKEVEIKIELPEGGSSVWQLLEYDANEPGCFPVGPFIYFSKAGEW